MKLALIIVALGLMAGCARAPQHRVSMHRAVTAPTFLADNEFVVEIEHDAAGMPVHFTTYGPVPAGQSCPQYEAVYSANAKKYNPPGFLSQMTCLHVMFRGPLGPDGAVVVQPMDGTPLGWALIAVGYTRMGNYIGAKDLHAVKDVATCRTEARDILKDGRHGNTSEPGTSLLIYCLPEPRLPTSKTLPNGDSVI